MSDIHWGPFTQIVDRFKNEEHTDKHVRYSQKKKFYAHDGPLPSGHFENAAIKRAEKHQAAVTKIREAFIEEFGPEAAKYLFPSEMKSITVAELRLKHPSHR
jgi:hypothetical protein